METFSALLAICAGNSPVSGEFPTQRPVTQNFDVFFDLRLDGRLSKHSWGWWLETPACPLWRQSNEQNTFQNNPSRLSRISEFSNLKNVVRNVFLEYSNLKNIMTNADFEF